MAILAPEFCKLAQIWWSAYLTYFMLHSLKTEDIKTADLQDTVAQTLLETNFMFF